MKKETKLEIKRKIAEEGSSLEDAESLAKAVADYMLDKKASDIKIMDVRNLTGVTDFFVICSASSDTQVKAISDNIIRHTLEAGRKPWHNEGYTNLSWVLLDFVDVVAHIFLNDTRKFYNLEGLWADAEVTNVTEESQSSNQ